MQSKPMLTAPDLAQELPEVSDVMCPVWPVWRWWCRHLWPGSAAQDATCVVRTKLSQAWQPVCACTWASPPQPGLQ